MSFMIVSGKRFICEVCGKTIQIEYEGGAKYTQIGEMNLLEQQETAEYLGLRGDNTYLYDIGICHDCFEKKVDKEARENSARAIALAEEIYTHRDETLNRINAQIAELSDSLVSNIGLSDILSISNDEKVERVLSDKHMAPAKRSKQIKDIVRKNRYEIEMYIIKKVFSQEEAKNTLQDYRETTRSKKEMIERLLRDDARLFIQMKTNEAEDLNGYIETVRYPLKGSVEENFYHEMEVDLLDLLDTFDIACEDCSVRVDVDAIADSVVKEEMVA